MTWPDVVAMGLFLLIPVLIVGFCSEAIKINIGGKK
jgi:hypothetical protein